MKASMTSPSKGDLGGPRETRGDRGRVTGGGRGGQGSTAAALGLPRSPSFPRPRSPWVSLGFPRSPRNRRGDDSGALLLLAGFILGVALIVTGLTLSEVSQLENEAVREQDATFIAEFRSLREKIGTALRDSVTSSTDTTAFTSTFENVADSFRSLETTRGYGFVAILAGGTDTGACTAANNKAAHSECETLTAVDAVACPASGRKFDTGIVFSDGEDGVDHSPSGPNYSTPILEGQCYDGTNDGIVMVGTLKAAYVYVHLDDPTLDLEEVVLYKLN